MLGRARAALTAAALLSVVAPAAGEDVFRSDVPGGDALPRRMTGERVVAAREPSGAATAARAPPGGVCGLAGADRARTPSSRCMACHDGTAGDGVPFSMGAPGRSMSHPVEIDYSTFAGARPDRYAGREALPPEVPLVDGKVSCTSCHDGASPDPRRVAIPLRLCQSCHRM